MNVNAFGVIRATQAFLPLLTKFSAARVINTSSGYGQLASLSADVPSYCLSKLTLNGATIMLAEALQDKGIVVNASIRVGCKPIWAVVARHALPNKVPIPQFS